MAWFVFGLESQRRLLDVLREELRDALTEVQLGVVGEAFNREFLQVLWSELSLLGLDHLHQLVVVGVRLCLLFVQKDLVLDVFYPLLGFFGGHLLFHFNLVYFRQCLSLNFRLDSRTFCNLLGDDLISLRNLQFGL